jgi:hypothetical protein
VHLGTEDPGQERERLAVLDGLIALGDDPQRLAGVRADVGHVSGQLIHRHGAVVELFQHGGHRSLLDLPIEPGGRDGLFDGLGLVIEDDPQSVPRHLAHGEH